MTNRARLMVHKLLQARVNRHADVLEAHKQKGPLFREAVEQLQRRAGTQVGPGPGISGYERGLAASRA